MSFQYEYSACCAAPIRCQAHKKQTQALLDAVVEHNAPLFLPAEAMEAEREVMHCSEVARLQLEELGPVDAPPQAAKLHSYKEAISDLNRSRPIFRPCKSNAKVPLVTISPFQLCPIEFIVDHPLAKDVFDVRHFCPNYRSFCNEEGYSYGSCVT